MPVISELDLPYLEMETPEFAADPFPHFDAARARHPWLAKWAHGYVVTDYVAIRDIFRMEDRMLPVFTSIVEIMGATGTPWGRFQASHMLNQTGEAHRRVRDVLAPAFSPRQVNAYRDLMRRVVSELLDTWAPKGAFDFEEFASYFPITVMCNLMGASPDVIPSLKASMEAIGMSTSMEPSLMAAMQNGVVILDAFVQRLVAERRQQGRRGDGDLLDLLLLAQDDGNLSDRELWDVLIFLFVAGYDTSKNVLTLTMNTLLSHPDAYRRCAEDADYARRTVEESLRFHGTATLHRLVKDDITYRDVLMPQHTMLWFSSIIATRDRRVVEDADDFRPEREQKVGHMAFGLGPHICLGQYLARAQVAEGLHVIAQRIRNPKSPGPAGWRPFPGVWGIQGLPITFEPA
jgi:cytochrome P450